MLPDRNIHPVRYQIFILALYVLLSIIVGWPILSNLNGVIIGQDNDIFINPWADWWTLKAIQDATISLWRTDYIFYPTGANLSFHSFSHLNTAVSLLLQPFVGVLPAFNLSIWLNYPFIGFAMYQLARYLTKSEVGSFMAGIAFAFSSHAIYQSSHPVLLSIWCFPWATLYFLRAIEEEKRSFAFIAALFVFLGTLSSTLLFFLMVLWFAFLTSYLWFSKQWKRPSIDILLIFAITSGITAIVIQLPLILDAVNNQNSSFIISDGKTIVADIIAPIAPHWVVWLWRGLYFGYIGIYIMLFARRSEGKIRIWVILLITAYLISIGPRPEILGRELNIILPWSYLFIPILRNMYRFNILTSMAVSILIAFGWVGIMTQIQTERGKKIGAVLLTLLLFADYTWPQMQYFPVEISPFYTEYLDEVDDDVILTQLPSNRQFDKFYLFLQTIHGRKITNGVISRAEVDTFTFIENNAILALRQTPEETPLPPENLNEALSELANINVGFIIFEKAFMDSELIDAWRSAMPATPIFEDEYLFVYALE